MRLLSSPRALPGDLRLLIISSLAFLPLTHAISFQKVPSPDLDLSGLGRVMLAGDFDSLSLYEYVGQDENGMSPNGSQSLYGRYPTGAFAELASSDGYIQSMCSFVAMDGTLNGVVVGGNFTGFGSNPAPAAALFNPTDGSITALNGLNGQVSVVYCDNTASTVYVGGTFTGANSTNAIAWVNGWTNLPFAGFNGPVSAITKMPNGNIVFGGKFTEIGNLTSQMNMIPVQPQVINVGSANITAVGASSTPKFSNPSDIICNSPESSTASNFLLEDNTPGSITADFGFGFQPSRIRVLNAQVANRGTKTWSLTFLPNGGIANFTYYDADGVHWCINDCPLVQNSTYQDFYFVNSIGMNSFQFNMNSWYGQGAGLGGIELFQNSIWSYAVDNFNSPNCDGVSNRNASATATGPWAVTPSGDSYSQYLTANIPAGTTGGSSDYSVVFTPNIERSGNYSINMWTPGCLADNTCATRGQVSITANLGSATGTASAPYTTTLYQTNNYLKFDQIYYGYIDAGSDGFRPSITLTPTAGQSGPVTVVAQSLGLNLTGAFSEDGSSDSSSSGTESTSSVSLVNGLYEYNPNVMTSSTNTSNSAIDAAGTSLNTGARVMALTNVGSTLYAAGSFSSDSFQNIMAIEDGNATDLANGGLNSIVHSTYYANGLLYAGGEFTNTGDSSMTGLRNVAAYSTSDKAWRALGHGVNGVVWDIIPIQVNLSDGKSWSAIAVSGYFDQINAFGEDPAMPVSNIALWIPLMNNWLENVGGSSIAVSGRLNAYTDVPKQSPIFSGALDSQTLGTRNAAALSSSKGLNVQQLQFDIQPATTTTTGSTTKRDVPQAVTNGAYTGFFYDENGLNLTIIGGHFTATASNGTQISNLAIMNGKNDDRITGLAYNTSDAASVYALATQTTTLYIGGSISNGLLIYNLATSELASSQPPTLSGSNGGAAHALALQPKSDNLYVGGNFERAGSLGCPGLCVYDTQVQQWSPPSTAFSGENTFNYLAWASATRLMLAGEFTVSGNRTTLASFNSKTNIVTTITGADTLPGPITAFTPMDSSFGSAYAAGTATSNNSAYLTYFNGKSAWTMIGGLGSGSKIQGLQVLSKTSSDGGNKLMTAGQVLLVMGLLDLPNYGNVSAALFNGTGFTPFALTTANGGDSGSIYGAFVQNPANLLTNHSNHLALGFVVLIGLACALGVVFLLVVLGILIERIRRRREGYVPAPTGAVMYEKSGGGNVGDIRANQLFSDVGKGTGGGPRI